MSPFNITPEFVQSLLEHNKALIKSNAELTAEVARLNDKVDELTKLVQKLTEQKNKNSKNSSKPPSSDGLKKPKSTREKSDKKQGGQKGHEGTNLAQRKPDRIVGCMPSKCQKCPHHDECMAKAKVTESRQVIDAVVQTEVVQYNKCRVTNCPIHGWSRDGAFPEGVNGPIQYGKNLQALVVSLNTVGAVSIARTHEILANVFDVPLSFATIKSMVARCTEKLSIVIPEIGNRLVSSEVDHADETGLRVDGYCTGRMCCAHLLRELTGVEENHPDYTWPAKFKDLLLEMKKIRDRKAENGDMKVSGYYQRKFNSMYDEIIEIAYAETPVPESKPGKKKGKTARGKVLALVDRLKEYKASVCLFIKNFAVQFDNNQAERDLRMTKAKSKISGCFRTIEGAQEYLDIMSYASTARKLGYNGYMAIQNAVSGDPMFIFS